MNNKTKKILVVGEGKYQGLDDQAITVEDEYSISFKKSKKEYVFSMYCYGSNSFLFVNVTKIYKFKVKDSEIKVLNFCFNYTLLILLYIIISI